MNSDKDLGGTWVYAGWLVQRSALRLGDDDPSSPLDAPFCRDGLGRPTMRGTGLAGALFATMRAGGHEPPATLTDPGDKMPWGSALSVFSTHPEPLWHGASAMGSNLEIGVNSSHRQDTGAAAHKGLFDGEMIPAGHRWPLLLSLDLHAVRRLRPNQVGSEELGMLQAALREWTWGRCWLGARPAAGLGWMTLVDLRCRQFSAAEGLDWHTCLFSAASNKAIALPELKPFGELLEEKDDSGTCLWPKATLTEAREATPPTVYVRLQGTIKVGAPRDEGWGVDTLSILGHEAQVVDDAELGPRVVGPIGAIEHAANKRLKERDKTIMLTWRQRDSIGKLEPLVPGATVRGRLRHAMSADARRQGARVVDPVTGSDYRATANATANDIATSSPHANGASSQDQTPWTDLDHWFGRGRQDKGDSSRVLVCDAWLCSPDWKADLLEHHAKDELTSGGFWKAKFDRMALVSGCFAWEIVICANKHEEKAAEDLATQIKAVLERNGGHGLALGGARTRGHGRVKWVVHSVATAAAGKGWLPTAEAKGGHEDLAGDLGVAMPEANA